MDIWRLKVGLSKADKGPRGFPAGVLFFLAVPMACGGRKSKMDRKSGGIFSD
jgi:hypothetical protein